MPANTSNRPTEFRLTRDHLALLRRAHWRWDDSSYGGAPAIDSKRPFGDSSVVSDVVQILGWTRPDGTPYDAHGEEVYADEDLRTRAFAVFEELRWALEIIFMSGRMAPGLYRRIAEHTWQRGTWELVAADPD